MRRFDPRLLRLAGAARAHLAVTILLGLATAALAIAEAGLLASAISDAVEHGRGTAALGPTLAALAGVLAARAVVAWARESTAHRSSARVKSTLRLALLRRAVELGPRSTVSAAQGEIVALSTHGLDALDDYFARYLPQLALAAILPVAVVLTILPADLVAGLTVALTLPIIVLFMVLVGMATEAHRRRRWRAFARLAHYFLDIVEGLPTLKVLGRADGGGAGLRQVTDAYRRATLGALRIAFLSAFVLELGATLSVALVAVGIGLRLVDGGLDLRTGLFVLVLAPEAYLPLRQLGAHFHASQQGLAAADAALAVIDAPVPHRGHRTDVPDLRTGELRISGLTVRQPGRGVAAPHRVSFELRGGEVLAIAGPSGVGKTTLLGAIAGLVAPDEGSIRITGPARERERDGDPAEGVDLRELAPAAWHRQIAWVAQDPYLFAGTVAENVRLAEPTATDAAISAALARVGLADLDPATSLGDRGSGLSAGQRRRIAVARAMVREAHLILLDEPTAGLDEATERTVLAAVRERADLERAAVVVVAHRPAALEIADRVVRLGTQEDVEAACADDRAAAA